MPLPEASQPRDWLRPTRPILLRPIERPTLLPLVTDPGDRDLFRSTLAAMAVGALFGLAIVLAIAS